MKKIGLFVMALTGLTAAPPVFAEVITRTETSFRLAYEARVTASPDDVLSAVALPADWWSSAHTYSGDAANITLDLRPDGCWCEALPGGGVKHGEVVLVWPERRLVRIDAPFGPLQPLGADAVLTISWADSEDGTARTLKWTYIANGPGTGAMADVIDGVIGQQFASLAASLGGSAAD